MIMKFETAVSKVLANEGGYVSHPSDPGGETNFGISKRWADKARVQIDIPNLTEKEAIEIYREYFWGAYGLDRVNDGRVAAKVFDALVLCGPSQAFKFLQRSLRCCGSRQVTDDGVLGPVTLRALDISVPTAILQSFRSEMAGFFRLLVAVDSKRQPFLNGWLKRAYDE